MSTRSYTFTHAITRAPGASVTQGLREADTGAPVSVSRSPCATPAPGARVMAWVKV